MEIDYFECLESTQKYLAGAIRDGKYSSNVAIVARKQQAGIGSRNNSWESKEGDLTFSFAINKEDLPSDLPISSASIYFAFLMKETLLKFNQKCWVKWPNDLYTQKRKCGGVITQAIKNFYVVGMGINLAKRERDFGYCGANLGAGELLHSYFMLLKKAPLWQEVFSKYRLEFKYSKRFTATVNGQKISLKDAILCEDGSLLIGDERIYSLR